MNRSTIVRRCQGFEVEGQEWAGKGLKIVDMYYEKRHSKKMLGLYQDASHMSTT